jgi:hypothetical protein
MDPTLLHTRLTDGSKVVSPNHRPLSTPQKHYLYASGTHFCYRLCKLQGRMRSEGLGKLEKCIRLIGYRTSYLPA